MEPLYTELQAAIERNLPAQVGDVLKARLEKADRDARKVTELQAAYERLTAQAAERAERIAELERLVSDHAGVDARIKAVEQRERNAEVAELKIRLECEQRFGAKVAEAMLGLVRNVEFRQSVMRSGSENLMASTSPGCSYPSSQPYSESTTTERSAK